MVLALTHRRLIQPKSSRMVFLTQDLIGTLLLLFGAVCAITNTAFYVLIIVCRKLDSAVHWVLCNYAVSERQIVQLVHPIIVIFVVVIVTVVNNGEQIVFPCLRPLVTTISIYHDDRQSTPHRPLITSSFRSAR